MRIAIVCLILVVVMSAMIQGSDAFLGGDIAGVDATAVAIGEALQQQQRQQQRRQQQQQQLLLVERGVRSWILLLCQQSKSNKCGNIEKSNYNESKQCRNIKFSLESMIITALLCNIKHNI
ncbi:uncharacterized protein LOC105422986 [Pogonomyrmex barbatus]|uniref:Uncharacterized protein LOC105422986 n=1 Tax=Pogonomyrmex barbatus TaxID=144034 RepID=A0A6I9VSW2_9HYME|nr:uncharacterized protein LOC105422986 [Pogonomyrmex barbatus]